MKKRKTEQAGQQIRQHERGQGGRQTGRQQTGKRQADGQQADQRTNQPHVRRQYKDTVFRMLFKDKARLLELYNAVSGGCLADPEALENVTLENAIYMGVKNDLAFLVDFHLYLYEHQSTVNPNMPLRFLQYVMEEYSRFTAEENIYGSRQIPLPAPCFVVFYNGSSVQPERRIMRLSESFRVRESEQEPSLELRVLMLNINEGCNNMLKEQCRTLGEYMQYVGKVREYAASLPMEEAVERAVNECIETGILRDFLLGNKAEVKRMSIYEYDEEATRRAIRAEEYERGWEEGRTEGQKAGEKAGRKAGERAGRREGIQILILDNIENGFTKEIILGKLEKRYGLTREKAEACYEAAVRKN